ncbi:DMT family transporter [Roseovarius indicus]|uniref:Carboxylate/amino acid/amine transporter n=1 Tax=Roseovarius indicus TaxID=540747 RepID=A0A0T5P2B8_9RHOB|nr:DMT family transporter [Roseovarius indicus]KRS15238.1 membrane protein [Roseovarius indicus]QEW24894.1 carboxylate/amino acid/amine transporter [Roseovarius indicus]SFE49247.1 Permease of the drug/metabolite transporter (DMT) superfamily [Roseovarius indicus]
MADASEAPRGKMSTVLFGAILAWIAVMIYASSNSIVTLLTQIGEVHQVMGRNAITFCNLLALGSLISLIPMVIFFHKDWTRDNLRALTIRDWSLLTVSAVLSSAVTPGLFFYALEYTTVTNVVLIGRIDPPLFILAAWFFLKEDLDPWAFTGGLVALVGAAVIILMKEGGASLSVGKGEIAAFVATLTFITSTLVTRAGLKGVPLGIFSIYRTVLGTAIYASIALYLYGPDHFQDLLAPVVLKWIWVYAIIVIIIGQLAWNLGLKYARSGDVALATSFSPLAAITIAMVMLGEDPGKGLIPGGIIILAGIAVAQYGRLHRERAERRAIEKSLELEGSANFKGV